LDVRARETHSVVHRSIVIWPPPAARRKVAWGKEATRALHPPPGRGSTHRGIGRLATDTSRLLPLLRLLKRLLRKLRVERRYDRCPCDAKVAGRFHRKFQRARLREVESRFSTVGEHDRPRHRLVRNGDQLASLSQVERPSVKVGQSHKG